MATMIDNDVTTRAKLKEMLTENTGRALCDSGDYYGRNWELNQGRDFDGEPEGSLRAYLHDGRLSLDATLSVYHWLAERVSYNAELDARWRQWCEANDEYLNLPAMESFVEELDNAQGLYGDGRPMTVNTYNHQSLLSQVLQYIYWEDDDGSHVLLQIHGGCDVRGGYTDAVAFDVDEQFFSDSDCVIGCPNGCRSWPMYDGHVDEGSNGENFDEYEPVEDRPEYVLHDPSQRMIDGIDPPLEKGTDTGKFYVAGDKLHCPCCGAAMECWA